MTVNTQPDWQILDTVCSEGYPGYVNARFKDANIFSDSSGYIKVLYYVGLNCSCPGVENHPEFAVINGHCEIGTWAVNHTVGDTVVYLENTWVHRAACIFRYCFSDHSTSSYLQIEYHAVHDTCEVTCGITIEEVALQKIGDQNLTESSKQPKTFDLNSIGVSKMDIKEPYKKKTGEIPIVENNVFELRPKEIIKHFDHGIY
jgi:hypothetical protein